MEEEYPEYLCSICKNRRPKIEWKRDFTYLELTSATQGFAKKNFLSEGGFGSVYSGEVDGLKIAVKQHKNASFQGEKEFRLKFMYLAKSDIKIWSGYWGHAQKEAAGCSFMNTSAMVPWINIYQVKMK